MFWQTKPVEDSSLDTLLKSENISLSDVLEDPFTLQEIRNQNKKLIEFLTREDVLLEMMQTALKPMVDTTLPIKQQYKNSHICSEILSLNSDELCEAVITSEPVLAVISEFMSDNCPVNHLVASFYMKIVCQLLSRHTDKMIEVLENGCFVDRCIENLHLSAVSELVYRLVSIPYDYGMGFKIRQWYVENGLVESSISLLDPSFPPAAHDNVAYLWTELVKVMREVLYSSEEKADPLLEKMQSPEMIEALLNKLIRLGSCEGVCESVVVNVCHILTTLIETNFVPNCPSHQLADDKGDINWTGGVPDNQNTLDGHQVWQPDPDRNVEMITSKFAGEILKMVLCEVKRDERGNSWLALLQLLVQLCDTMHLPTHKLLYDAFKKENLKELFFLVWDRPQMSCLHKLLHKIINYILYTASQEESPLVAYIFKELDLVSLLSKGMHAQCAMARISLICVRSFFCNLADSLEIARNSGPNKERIESELKSSPKWNDVCKLLEAYNEWNRPVEPSSSSEDSFLKGVRRMSLNETANDDDFFAHSSNNQCLQLAQHSLREFDVSAPSQHLPEVFESSGSNKMKKAVVEEIFDIRTGFYCNPATDLEKVSIDENEFELLCSLRASNEFNLRKMKGEDEWPGVDVRKETSGWPSRSTPSDPFEDWPMIKKNEVKDSLFPVHWDHDNSTDYEHGLKNHQSETSKSEDLWADFNSPMDFPNSDKTASQSSQEDPVMVGLASGMMTGSSEC